jgi:hypothetical protein
LRVIERIAESTSYLADSKVHAHREAHELVNRVSNSMTYPNRRGYEETYPAATRKDVRAEIARIKSRELWSHSTPLLVVLDQACETASWQWDHLLDGVPAEVVEFSDGSTGPLRRIKGLEYQHAIIAIGEPLFRDLESGFEGSGAATYRRRGLLRIPFPRAKDSLVTIVTPSAPMRPRSPFAVARLQPSVQGSCRQSLP